jgi:high-affinity iron transporter
MFGAGILSYSLHELGKMGALPAALDEPLWDISGILSHKDGPGSLLKASVGYYANPSLLQVAAYLSYLAAMLVLFFRPFTGRPPVPAGQKP